MIDTHSHVYAEEFKDDLDAVVQRAVNVGVEKVLLPNIDLESIGGLNNLVDERPDFFFRMMGLHPCSVKEDYKQVLQRIERELDDKSCVAVGEIGIDLYWDKSTQAIQEEAFLIQCNWAIERNLPIVIHSRESIGLIIDLLKKHFPEGIKGVFHCFTGTEEQAKQIEAMGMYMGIGGVVTFKNSNLRDVLKAVNPQRLILETDAPYLAPVPYRGKRNEPSYLTEVAKELSKVYGKTPAEIGELTTENALQLFNL